MGLLLLLNTPAPSGIAPPVSEVLRIRFIYDLIFRGEIREEDNSFLNAGQDDENQKIVKAKLIRITEAI
jgi:hypothetical protein